MLGEKHIVDLGVRCFDSGEDSDGKPHNQTRRIVRCARNRLHMRRWRLNQLLRLFCNAGIIPRPDARLLMTPPRAKGEPEVGPWQLRAQGLERQLDPVEWARVLYHLVISATTNMCSFPSFLLREKIDAPGFLQAFVAHFTFHDLVAHQRENPVRDKKRTRIAIPVGAGSLALVVDVLRVYRCGQSARFVKAQPVVAQENNAAGSLL